MSKQTADRRSIEQSRNRTTKFYAWIGAIGFGLLVGAYGVFRLLTEGTIVLGISNQLPWGLLISTYEFFLLMSAGVMVGVVALSLVFGISKFDLVVKRALLLAAATLGAGLFTILIGLGRPERPIVHALINANPSSAIWWVIMFAGSFAAALVALLVVVETEIVESKTVTNALAGVGLVLGICVAVAAGMIFGTAQTRPYYGGPLAPLYFIVTGILSGVAAIGLVVTAEYRASAREMSEDLRTLMTDYVGKILGLLLGAALIIVLVKAIYGLTSTSDSTALAYEQMLFGSFGPIYWVLGILVGLVVPLALMMIPKTRSPGGVMAASGMALLGLFVTRYEFVVGGQVASLTPDPGLEYPIVSYTPSLIEWTVVIFAFALCALIYTVGSQFLQLDRLPKHIRDESMTTPATAETDGGTDDE